jgi:hypothetical protein
MNVVEIPSMVMMKVASKAIVCIPTKRKSEVLRASSADCVVRTSSKTCCSTNRDLHSVSPIGYHQFLQMLNIPSYKLFANNPLFS